jgi:hypothetical protein
MPHLNFVQILKISLKFRFFLFMGFEAVTAVTVKFAVFWDTEMWIRLLNFRRCVLLYH